MMFPSKEKVDMIKKLYPVGTKIVLDFMDDIQAPPSGTVGEVLFVDSIGQLQMNWENGSGLALNVDIDKFHILRE